MVYTIAVAGKGGTGKTTFTGLLIDYLANNGENSILAVDADANANLHEVLGVEYDRCISDVRDTTLSNTSDYKSMSKSQLINYLIHQTLVESDEFDLLVMGRPEGKKCYCFVNSLLRTHLEILSNNYDYVVIDNEAGMEHLSRMNTKSIDLLVLVTDPSQRGLLTTKRIKELIDELGLSVKEYLLLVNKTRAETTDDVIKKILDMNIKNILVMPLDNEISTLDEKGIPLIQVGTNSPLKNAIQTLAKQILEQNLKGEIIG